jgi:hypothetical protein
VDQTVCGSDAQPENCNALIQETVRSRVDICGISGPPSMGEDPEGVSNEDLLQGIGTTSQR